MNMSYEHCINEAFELENSKSIFEYIVDFMALERYNKIAELYEKAGNICHKTNVTLSLEHLKKACKYYAKAKRHYKHIVLLSKIANLNSKNNYIKSIEELNQCVCWYQMNNHLIQAFNNIKLIGDIYFENNKFEESYLNYNKIIIGINNLKKMIISLNLKNNTQNKLHHDYIYIKKIAIIKIEELYYMKKINMSLNELFSLYLDTSDDYLHSNMGLLTDFIFNGLLINLINNINEKKYYEKYSKNICSFHNTDECKFISNCFNLFEMKNISELFQLCDDYAQKSNPSKIQLLLLSEIKNVAIRICNDIK